MKKKLVLIISTLVVLSFIFFIVDYIRIKNMKLPVLCIKYSTYLDGGSSEYLGLGYKVIVYKESSIGEKSTIKDIKIGSIFMKFNKPDYFLDKKIKLINNLSAVNYCTLYNPFKGTIVLNNLDNSYLISEIIKSLQEYYKDENNLENEIINPSYTFEIKFDTLGDDIWYTVFSNNKNIIDLLKNADIYNKLVITENDIHDVKLTRIINNKEAVITDKGLIRLVLDNYYDNTNSNSEILVEYKLKDTNKILKGSLLKNKIPLQINNLF